MKKHLIPAAVLTLVMLVFFTVIYPVAVWGIAQFSPNSGKGEIIEHEGRHHYANIGQSFIRDDYFWSRPSAVDYNAGGSGGSNKGPSNEEYLASVQARIDTFLSHNPGMDKSQVPVDLITASGSGLDPHISIQAAEVQVARVARKRNLPEDTVSELVASQAEKPLLGIFGPARINVLKLNLALDELR
ncbi:potassium-transporting ATPase KdpC subunit [Parapedobacter defluvii]|uniref:Potassium-transporting ATPase KdpC subunit n=1 Tax=Parapedobacter defluvii TaxID=2045106 RepID=A0ABQ1MQM7_9SPHI|nr:K(+)-transporting ATPase subunit C [Parapedobacter defluvii]GGC42514.1 potassium-transporting ATPase KdpC subunit [Parapedobacter defluvii]